MLPAFATRLVNQFGNALQLSRSDHDIHERCSLENQALILLSHTAHDSDYFFRVAFLDGSHAAQSTVGFVFGLFADAARVEQNRIRVLGRIRDLVSLTAQAGHDHFAVQHIHLAANGFDVQQFGFGGIDRFSHDKFLSQTKFWRAQFSTPVARFGRGIVGQRQTRNPRHTERLIGQ